MVHGDQCVGQTVAPPFARICGSEMALSRVRTRSPYPSRARTPGVVSGLVARTGRTHPRAKPIDLSGNFAVLAHCYQSVSQWQNTSTVACLLLQGRQVGQGGSSQPITAGLSSYVSHSQT
jgi:hypothetical protein